MTRPVPFGTAPLAVPEGPLTLTLVLFDRSGLMERYGEAPGVCLSQYLSTLREDDECAHLCGILSFASNLRVELPTALVDGPVDIETPAAEGGTLLWGAAEHVLDRTLRWWARSTAALRDRTKVVVALITDGQDNASDLATLDRLRKHSARARDLGFQLVTFGIGVDGPRIALEMGWPPCESVTMDASKHGLHRASSTLSRLSTGRLPSLADLGWYRPEEESGSTGGE